MKILLLSLAFLTCTTYSQDAIIKAIIKSDPKWVKIEIKNRIKAGKPITKEDQLKYIDFCEEVIIRRRNAIQFPSYFIQQPHYYYYGPQLIPYYYTSEPVYQNAYSTDENPKISFNCGARLALGILGTIAALLYWQDSISNDDCAYNETTHKVFFASGVVSFIALFSAVIEIDIKRKNHQEELYNNAIEIKHMFINLKTV